jgi:nucleotide-binding universal stress UspA family protein
MQTAKALKLDSLAVDPRLARRLPADLARRCHALLLAEDKGRVTVAMADPDDAAARQAVLTALGTEAYVVQGDPVAIDTQLATIWRVEPCQAVDLLVSDFPVPVSGEVWAYAQALGGLLGARVRRLSPAEAIDGLLTDDVDAVRDRIILGVPSHLLMRRLLSQGAKEGIPSSPSGAMPLALLATGRPRWPLRAILLVLWGNEADDAAMDWVVRLAASSGAKVTALAVVPPVPAMYGRRAGVDQGLGALLASATPLGRQMRRAARRLVDSEIEGTLRMRQGPPDWQICREIVQGDYDLIAAAAKPCRWWVRCLEGDPIDSLLHKADRPVLIARPATG